jgi:hypothetical protein
MLINIVVTTMAANPAVAFKPGDYLVSVGFRLRHGHSTIRKYMRINNTCQYEVRNYLRNTARIKSGVVGLAHLCVGGFPGGRLCRRCFAHSRINFFYDFSEHCKFIIHLICGDFLHDFLVTCSSILCNSKRSMIFLAPEQARYSRNDIVLERTIGT